MDWMEFIKVQVVGKKISQYCKNFLQEFIHSENVRGLTKIKRYENFAIDGGHAIILFWSTKNIPIPCSEMAKSLIHGLKQFGLVDHNVWVSPIE